MRKVWVLPLFLAAFLGALALPAPQAFAETDSSQSATTLDSVILVTSSNYPDALVAASAAGKTGSPVLYSERDRLPQETLSVLSTLKPRLVYVFGGPRAISDSVKAELESMGYVVIRVWGATKYGTAVSIASQFWGSSETAVIAQDRNGSPNATASAGIGIASRIAAELRAPLFLVPGEMPSEVASSISSLGVTTAITVGVSDSVRQSLLDMNVSVKDHEAYRQEIESQIDANAKAEGKGLVLRVIALQGFSDLLRAPVVPSEHAIVRIISDSSQVPIVVHDAQSLGVSSAVVIGGSQLALDANQALSAAGIQTTVISASPALAAKSELEARVGGWLSERSKAKSYSRGHSAEFEARVAARLNAMRLDYAKLLAFAQASGVSVSAKLSEASELLRQASQLADQNDFEGAMEKIAQAQSALHEGFYMSPRAFAASETETDLEIEARGGETSRLRMLDISSDLNVLQAKISSLTDLNSGESSVQALLSNAQSRLDNALSALDSNQLGRAFGQANSARVLVSAAERILLRLDSNSYAGYERGQAARNRARLVESARKWILGDAAREIAEEGRELRKQVQDRVKEIREAGARATVGLRLPAS